MNRRLKKVCYKFCGKPFLVLRQSFKNVRKP
jgi:hypothetical protein